MRGTFIVIEGPDGSGTTHQSEWLAERLHKDGRDVLLTAEPSDGTIGAFVRRALKEGEAISPEAMQLLFTADRAQHIETVIEPALSAGKTVICDRYIPSTLIYGQAQGLPLNWLQSLNKIFIQPDVLILTLPPFEICMERIGRRPSKDMFEQEAFQRKVYEGYARFARESSSAITVDTSGEKEKTAEQVWQHAQNRMRHA
jgi:dTMP kinase